MERMILAAFIFIHGAIHLSYLSPPPPATADGPAWPFTLDRSWLLSPVGVPAGRLRLLGLSLTALTFVTFVLAAMSVVGVMPATVSGAALVVGAASSIALLTLFFHPWLVLGLVIDAALLWLASSAPSSPTSV